MQDQTINVTPDQNTITQGAINYTFEVSKLMLCCHLCAFERKETLCMNEKVHCLPDYRTDGRRGYYKLKV